MYLAMNKDLNVVLDDLSQVKGFIGQLQGTIHRIIKKTPSLNEFNDLIHLINGSNSSFGVANGTNEFQINKIKALLNTNQMKLCIKFKQLYELDELPFLKMLSLLNLKNKDEDNYQIINFIMDYHRTPQDLTPNFEALDQMSKGKSMDVDWNQTSSDLTALLPELLPLKDDKLLRRVFIDKSFIDPVIEIANFDEYNELFNDKLTLRGSAYLKLILFEILEYKFPKIYYEDLNLLVEKLTDPNILFKLAIVYRLLDRFKYKLSSEIDTTHKISAIGGLFLSYIGGLSMEYQLSYLKVWVFKVYRLFLPKVKDLDMKYKSVDDVLMRQFQFFVEDYNFEELDTDPYVVKLTVGGQSSFGTNSNSFEEARKRAVKEFMNTHLKTALEAQYQKHFIEHQLHQKVSQFHQLIREKNIVVQHDINTAGEFHNVIIRWNSVILGVAVDKVKEVAIQKCERNSYDNLVVLLE